MSASAEMEESQAVEALEALRANTAVESAAKETHSEEETQHFEQGLCMHTDQK